MYEQHVVFYCKIHCNDPYPDVYIPILQHRAEPRIPCQPVQKPGDQKKQCRGGGIKNHGMVQKTAEKISLQQRFACPCSAACGAVETRELIKQTRHLSAQEFSQHP